MKYESVAVKNLYAAKVTTGLGGAVVFADVTIGYNHTKVINVSSMEAIEAIK